MTELFTATATWTALGMSLVWVLSLFLRDASIVDVAWGIGFVGIGTISFATIEPASDRGIVLTALIAIWGLRLSIYLLWRNWGKPEDPRYVAMRHNQGPWFPLKSLLTVFALQGVLMWVVSLPLQLGQLPAQEPMGILDAIGIATWCIGLFFETVSDWQLARFRAHPENHNQVMRQGLWALTRHPNYFGDFLIWWGIFIVACSAPLGTWSIAGPLIMSVLLMRVSGVTMLERSISNRRPAYIDYVRDTPAFFPRCPPTNRTA